MYIYIACHTEIVKQICLNCLQKKSFDIVFALVKDKKCGINKALNQLDRNSELSKNYK